jgi:outer membrane protein assembly factor BamD
MKYSLAFFIVIWLTGCSIFGAPTELDETKGWQADRIYAEADQKMRDRDYEKALKYFKTLESRYTHGKYDSQAKLETS